MGVCLEAGYPIELDPALAIDFNLALDIVTFDIESLSNFCRGRKFYELLRDPPPALRKGDSIAFHGYPGGRRAGKDTGVEFGRSTFAVTVADTSDFKICADVSAL
jgi:hypothetical protein